MKYAYNKDKKTFNYFEKIVKRGRFMNLNNT